ncbi:AbrB/MazE/SpoVT family DNA-binding domain-containing protein [Halosegnis rubeus]|jgi:phosphate uptake regulator|uniref:AbrB/MazE/SpoVT family DNA-binding domain-containing protein n=1 Tax=Halosegnis rubeus TaxID=2212850 RepID=A0A5N5U8R3_9EURY|nr:phosphate uptake regulator PhoU [Halosegnis rubeus]KAB7514888.1 AbrB/MazE/SpoVT family DNA-binding domain-containing protein [Halosegnis rubeus]KAB7518197.1 AbrB/MazE/SpoVT family DNA-binding domain-containing protein [Halosegnis rubeus]KAB7519223.1 AbrB/MazE/SpoVT family DNA-binding domain-containing protein [Halosegnis rubeus]
METRKVQRLGPSTLAMTLPAEWAKAQNVEKGDEVSLRTGGKGTLTVLPESVQQEESEAIIHADELEADAIERAILAQYVLGRRVIQVEVKDGGTLNSGVINAVYNAETQLMGLGVIEETPERIAIRCSVDPEDFTLDNLLERLESTGSTMRNEAVKALAHGNPDLAQRALNRERQANKIFVLLLRLIFTAYQNPNLARAVGLDSGFPLIGYRTVAKNLELTADNAEDIAEIVIDAGENTLDVDDATLREIREFTDTVNEMTELGVRSVVERDYDLALQTKKLFRDVEDSQTEILTSLPEMDNDKLLQVREVLVALQQTAQYAVRNAEIATNLALDTNSEYVTIT